VTPPTTVRVRRDRSDIRRCFAILGPFDHAAYRTSISSSEP
jgi:hypothetical protein